MHCLTWTFSGPWEEAKWSCYKRRYILAHLPHNLLSMHYIVMHGQLFVLFFFHGFCGQYVSFYGRRCKRSPFTLKLSQNWQNLKKVENYLAKQFEFFCNCAQFSPRSLVKFCKHNIYVLRRYKYFEEKYFSSKANGNRKTGQFIMRRNWASTK